MEYLRKKKRNAKKGLYYAGKRNNAVAVPYAAKKKRERERFISRGAPVLSGWKEPYATTSGKKREIAPENLITRGRLPAVTEDGEKSVSVHRQRKRGGEKERRRGMSCHTLTPELSRACLPPEEKKGRKK